MEQLKQYDTAISFSEKDRNIAVAIAAALRAKGISCYYYADNMHETLGKELKKALKKIYQYQSRFSIIIISEHYLKSKWTVVELKAILEKGKAFPETIIPIKTDNTLPANIKGLNPELGYIEYRYSPENVVTEIIRRLGNNPPTQTNQESPINPPTKTMIQNTGTIKGDQIISF